MCGIVGYVGPKKVVPVIVEGLRRLEYRGYDSAGIAVGSPAHSTLQVCRAPGKLANLEESLNGFALEGTFGIGHTRWATHGRPTEENAHPHRDCTGEIVVVHNGIIENYLELKHQLIAEGHTFQTETDTEIIAHLIEKYSKGVPLEDAVQKTVKLLSGAYALVAMSTRDPNKIVAARLGPPVVIGLGQNEFFVASDIPAILSHTREAFFMGDGEIAGTAIEVPLKARVQLGVIKGRTIAWPQFENDDAIMTVGAYRPLDDALRIAFTELVHWIHKDYGLSELDAYELLSQVGKIHLNEMVDPNYVIVASIQKKYLPPKVAAQ